MRTLPLLTAAAAVLALAASPAGDRSLPDGPGAAGDGSDRGVAAVEEAAEEIAPPAGRGAPARTHAAAQPDGQELTGTFTIAAGQCDDGAVTSGSSFRMVNQAGGYVDNGSSPCGDDTYTPLRPGTDGGLVTGEHQPHPDPAFDGGNGLADRITQPQPFFGTEFSTATNPTDPQTSVEVPAPRIVHDGSGNLSGDVRAFAAAWNGQHFNQGAPKPDGSRPSGTTGPTGTYDPDTGAFTLEWSSRIQGGPFNGFTGEWHLEGTFEPAAGSGGSDASPGTDASPEDDSREDGDGQETRSTGPAAGDDGDPAAPGHGDEAAGTSGQDGSDETVTGDQLPRTGPGLPPAAGLLLLAGGAALMGRRRGTADGTRP